LISNRIFARTLSRTCQSTVVLVRSFWVSYEDNFFSQDPIRLLHAEHRMMWSNGRLSTGTGGSLGPATAPNALERVA
jgi:hypothetical protein